MLSRLKSFFSVDTGNPELLQAQLAAFTKQVPLLYFMLMTNTIALTLTHLSTAPLYLTVYIPSVLYAMCILRVISWWRTRHRTISDQAAARRLKGTVYLTMLLGAGFTSWSMVLFRYGDAYSQVHVAFYMANTVIGCIFCLMHLRTAALLLTGVVLVPFTLFFASTGNPVFIAIAINVLFVAVAMIFILFTHYRDFVNLIESKKALVTKQIETQRLSDENDRLANLDALTDLPNRRRFRTEFEARLADAQKHNYQLAVGIIDLDGFKPVNDAFGHSVGDKLLMEAAHRLSLFSDSGVFAARLGGDEFGLIVENQMSTGELKILGDRMCEALQRPYHLAGITAMVSGSLGFARFPEAGRAPDQLFERADFALYHAKQHLRGQTVVFSEEHELEITKQSRVDQQLKCADLESELSVVFQPFVDSFTHKILGFEALARWDNASLGRISPDIFIRSAERAGTIAHVTEILFRKALSAAAQWPSDVRLSFNLSSKDIVSHKTMERLTSVLDESGFAPERLDFEVTETAVISNFQLASDTLNILIEKGIGIALDDFGTGHSSLGYVHRLPLRKIKIDRSFIIDIETNALSQNIVKTIVDLCRNIGCGCVVEGMETWEQVQMLRALGCRIMQGYYFGRPMTLAASLERLAEDPAPNTIEAEPVRKSG